MTGFFLLCPLPPEAAAAKAGLLLHDRSRRGRGSAVGSERGRVRIVGMGSERAGRACARLASSLPEGVPVVVLGVAGALTTGFDAGDLFVADAVGFAEVQPGGVELEVNYVPRRFDRRSEVFGTTLAVALQEGLSSTRQGAVLTTTRTVRGRERARLAETGAVICDTESAAFLPLAERRPLAIVRAVVDSPDRELASLRTVTGGISALRRLADAARVIAGVLEREDGSPSADRSRSASRGRPPPHHQASDDPLQHLSSSDH
jgi:nucleoside phosphorylase